MQGTEMDEQKYKSPFLTVAELLLQAGSGGL